MIDPTAILRQVAALFDVSVAELHSTRRRARLTPARQAAAWALRQAGLGMVEIGEYLHRDHTTMTYSVQQAERRAASDPGYAARLRALQAATSPPPTPAAPVPPARQPLAMTPQLRLSLT